MKVAYAPKGNFRLSTIAIFELCQRKKGAFAMYAYIDNVYAVVDTIEKATSKSCGNGRLYPVANDGTVDASCGSREFNLYDNAARSDPDLIEVIELLGIAAVSSPTYNKLAIIEIPEGSEFEIISVNERDDLDEDIVPVRPEWSYSKVTVIG